MKRYLVFAGEYYYPCGGWGDFKGSTDTIDQAKSFDCIKNEDWWHVIDSTTGESVAHSPDDSD